MTESANNKFRSMDGIRAIIAFWILIEHEYILGLIPLHTKNMASSASVRLGFEDKYLLLKNMNLVDTFFLIGGLIRCSIFKLDLRLIELRYHTF